MHGLHLPSVCSLASTARASSPVATAVSSSSMSPESESAKTPTEVCTFRTYWLPLECEEQASAGSGAGWEISAAADIPLQWLAQHPPVCLWVFKVPAGHQGCAYMNGPPSAVTQPSTVSNLLSHMPYVAKKMSMQLESEKRKNENVPVLARTWDEHDHILLTWFENRRENRRPKETSTLSLSLCLSLPLSLSLSLSGSMHIYIYTYIYIYTQYMYLNE